MCKKNELIRGYRSIAVCVFVIFSSLPSLVAQGQANTYPYTVSINDSSICGILGDAVKCSGKG